MKPSEPGILDHLHSIDGLAKDLLKRFTNRKWDLEVPGARARRLIRWQLWLLPLGLLPVH